MAGTAVNARCGSDKKIKVYRMDDLDFFLLLYRRFLKKAEGDRATEPF